MRGAGYASEHGDPGVLDLLKNEQVTRFVEDVASDLPKYGLDKPWYQQYGIMMGNIVRLQLGRIKKRVAANHGIPFEYGDDVVQLIVSRCTEAESGGRVVDAILTNTVLPRISLEYLQRLSNGEALKAVRLAAKDGEFEYGFD